MLEVPVSFRSVNVATPDESATVLVPESVPPLCETVTSPV